MNWSASKLKVLAECSEKFRRRYIELEGGDFDNAGNLIGKAVHWAAQQATEARIAGQDIDLKHAVEQAEAHFEGLLKADTEAVNPIPWEDGQLEARRKDVVQLAQGLILRLPGIWQTYGEPTAAEWKFEALPWRGHGLNGQMDARTTGALIDWKTGKRPLSQDYASRSIQRLFYTAAVQEVHGVFVPRFAFVQMYRQKATKTKPDRYSFLVRERETRPEELDLLKRMLDDAEAIVQAHAYQLNIDSNLCDPRWCPFFTMGCPAGLLRPELLEPEEVIEDEEEVNLAESR